MSHHLPSVVHGIAKTETSTKSSEIDDFAVLFPKDSHRIWHAGDRVNQTIL